MAETDTDVRHEFRQHVRKRPSMYIGNVDSKGLHWMVYALVLNSLDEAADGFVHSINVVLHSDGSLTVSDDGRGIPVGPHPKFGKPGLEVALTEPNLPNQMDEPSAMGCAWRNSDAYAVANALSEWLRIETRCDGHAFVQEYRQGVPVGPPKGVQSSGHTGITITLKPDRTIFSEAAFSFILLHERLREYAFLHSGVRIALADEATGTDEHFQFGDGIQEFVRWLNQTRTPLHTSILVVRGEQDGIAFEIGVQFCRERDDLILGFVNDEKTTWGGTHVTGMRVGLSQALKGFMRESGSATGKCMRWTSANRGLTAVISIRMASPQFAGATKAKLASPQIRRVVAPAVRDSMRAFFLANPGTAEAIIQAE